jgi:hypothetical protein
LKEAKRAANVYFDAETGWEFEGKFLKEAKRAANVHFDAETGWLSEDDVDAYLADVGLLEYFYMKADSPR